MRGSFLLLKNSLRFKTREILLSVIVLFWLYFTDKLFKSGFVNPGSILFLQFFVLIAENYITTSVYCGVKESVSGKTVVFKDIFRQGLYFFIRIFLYKLLFALAAGIIIIFTYGFIDTAKTMPVTQANFLAVLLISWLAVPVYFLLLTLFAPLVIIIEDCGVVQAIKKSIVFISDNLPDLWRIIFCIVLLWLFAFYSVKLYNMKNLFFLILNLCFVALLEIFTIKVLMSYYNVKEGENSK
jgi:hypothetical protein